MVKEPPTVDIIVNAASKYFGIPKSAILDSTNKTRNVVNARRIAMYITHQVTHQSYVRVGKRMGFTGNGVYRAIEAVNSSSSRDVKDAIAKITEGLS